MPAGAFDGDGDSSVASSLGSSLGSSLVVADGSLEVADGLAVAAVVSGASSPHPDDVAADEVLDGLPGVLAEMLLEVARLRAAEPTGTVRRWGLRRSPRA